MEHANPNRKGYRGVVFGILLITWMVFSGFFDAFHLTLGVISCGLVTWMSSDLLFEDRSIPLAKRARQTVRFFLYLGWPLWQVVLANLHLFRLAFGKVDALEQQIIRYETSLKSDFEKYVLANSITLTPGTVTMKIVGNTFYIHAISDVSAKGLDGEMERRIAAIFADSDNESPTPS